MKIRKKIVLLFTFIVGFILVAFNIYIYLFSSSFSQKVFFDRLKERATIAATVFLEEDEISQNVFNQIKAKYFRSLHGEVIRIYNSQDKSVFLSDSIKFSFPNYAIQAVKKHGHFEYSDGDRSNVGILYKDNQGVFVILVSAVDNVGIEKIKYLERILMIGFILSIIIVVFAGRFLVDRMLIPIARMVKKVNKITATNLNLRLDEGKGKDELAQLAVTFNRMLKRLEGSFEMQKRFIHHASHELRNPLTAIIGEAEVTLSKPRQVNEYIDVLNIILYEAERLNKLTSSLLQIAEMSSGDNFGDEEVRIDELLWELKHDFSVKGREVNLHLSDFPSESSGLAIPGKHDLLYSGFYNVIDNAIKFSNNKPVNIYLHSENDKITVTVKDQGIGIPIDAQKNIFQFFYRGENALTYPGSGIGLSLFEKIIELHQGVIELNSAIDKGTTIKVTFSKFS